MYYRAVEVEKRLCSWFIHLPSYRIPFSGKIELNCLFGQAKAPLAKQQSAMRSGALSTKQAIWFHFSLRSVAHSATKATAGVCEIQSKLFLSFFTSAKKYIQPYYNLNSQAQERQKFKPPN